MSPGSVHLNGRIVPAETACIGVYDAGFLHGASTFTTMLAHNGAVFRLKQHLQRLLKTAEMLGFQVHAEQERLRQAVAEVIKANALSEARVRITLTPGSIHGGEPTTLVTAEPLPEYPASWYEQGIAVVVTALKQAAGDPTFGYKTGCYLPRVLARREAAAKGAEEAIWFTADNRLAEACFCNVFLVLDGKVLTPAVDTPVLPGIARGAVIELCGSLKIPCDDAAVLTVKEMLAAQEVFVTGSTTGIRPVVRIERHAVGDEKPGAITKKLMIAYGELMEKECPPTEGAKR